MKKLISIVLFFMLLFVFPSASVSQQAPTFLDYSTILQNELYPAIKNHIHSFQFQPPNQEKAHKLTEEIDYIIHEFKEQGKLPSVLPPRIAVVKLENELFVIFILEVKLELIDYEESIEGILITSVSFKKRFVILTIEKKHPDIEV